MKAYKGYLIDLDGTLYLGDERIEAAPAFVQSLREKNKAFLFLSNNPTHTPRDVVDKLDRMGIQAYEEEVYNSPIATADYLKSKGYKRVYVIGEESFTDLLEEAGFHLDSHDVDAVVVAMDRGASYGDLKKASLLVQEGAPLIVTNPDLTLPTEEGKIPGSGAFLAFMESATGVEATVIGKPSPVIMEAGIQKLGISKEEVLMVGDNYKTDILAGIENDIDTLQVLTGLYNREEVEAMAKQPTYIVDTLDQWMIQ